MLKFITVEKLFSILKFAAVEKLFSILKFIAVGKLFSILKFIAVVRNATKNSDAILMHLGGIGSIATAFSVSNPFRSFLIMSIVEGLKENLQCLCNGY